MPLSISAAVAEMVPGMTLDEYTSFLHEASSGIGESTYFIRAPIDSPASGGAGLNNL
jgi:hypothetical protein